MSGGKFQYDQYKIGQIAEDIQQTIDKNGLKLDEDLIKENKKWYGNDYYERFPEELYHYKYPDNVIEKFKEAVDILKKAEIYAQRIDWLLSGDDGEESFFRRLEEDLKQIENDKLVPFSETCYCSPKNGGDGICHCNIADTLVLKN
jgi:hypothetical protein